MKYIADDQNLVPDLLVVVNDLSFLVSHRLNIVIEAKNQGFNVHVASGYCSADLKTFFAQRQITVHEILIKRGSRQIITELRTIVSIFFLMRRLRPRLVHLVSIKACLYGGVVARFLKVPSVLFAISGLGYVFTANGFGATSLRRGISYIYRFVCNHPNAHIIVQNEADRVQLISMTGIGESKCTIVSGSGVDTHLITYKSEPDGPPTVSLAARLLRTKGIFDYVDAARIVKNVRADVRFILIGGLDADNPESLTVEDIRAISLLSVVDVVGYSSRVHEFYERSHVVCLPSYREGLPKSLLEAAAVGRSIVTTDVPGCRDAILPGITGLLVPPKQPQLLADAILWLVENSAYRRAMGVSARICAEKKFSVNTVVSDHMAIYQRLLEKNR